MRRAHFKTEGHFNGRGKARIIIDREHGVLHVRPYRERRLYSLPLSTVAELIVVKVVKRELEEQGVRFG